MIFMPNSRLMWLSSSSSNNIRQHLIPGHHHCTYSSNQTVCCSCVHLFPQQVPECSPCAVNQTVPALTQVCVTGSLSSFKCQNACRGYLRLCRCHRSRFSRGKVTMHWSSRGGKPGRYTTALEIRPRSSFKELVVVIDCIKCLWKLE